MALIYLKKKRGASEENNKIKEDTTITSVTRFFFTGLYTRWYNYLDEISIQETSIKRQI